MRRMGWDKVRMTPMEHSPQHALDPTWTAATSWGGPLDDLEFALDPTGDWYDETVHGEVMELTDDIPKVTQPKKGKRSKVSVSN